VVSIARLVEKEEPGDAGEPGPGAPEEPGNTIA